MSLYSVFFALLSALSVVSAEYKNELVLQDERSVGAVVLSKQPSPSEIDLPASYDLRQSGLLTSNLNQQ
jgi:hypothetical protein